MACKLKNMRSIMRAILVIIGTIVFMQSYAQLPSKKNHPVLFTDRDYCISGDTLWFKVFIPEGGMQNGNIIRVQLNGKGTSSILNVIKKTESAWTNGFMPIPDSLSTGQYFITALRNADFNTKDVVLESKSLLVYNRFSEEIQEIELAKSNDKVVENISFNSIKIETDKKYEIKIYKNFIDILSELKNRNLKEEQKQSIEKKLEQLELNFNPENKKKFYRRKLEAFKKYLRDELSLISKGYYTAIGMSLGMCFGVAMGSSIFGGSIGTSSGLAFGMIIGLVIGKNMDINAEKEGRVLNI